MLLADLIVFMIKRKKECLPIFCMRPYWEYNSNKRLIFASVSLLALMITNPVSLTAEKTMSPCQTEALSNSYDVLRKGKRIGSHTICFKEENDKLYVSAETKMKVKFLFFTAYRYQYVSREVWSNGSLNSVSTRVNDNGDKIATDAVRSQGSIKAKFEDTSSQIPFDFYTTNHWNSAAV